MRFAGRLAPLFCLAAGCGFAQKPYADDPLLRGGRSVWTIREPRLPAPQLPVAPPQIEPPQPPATSPRVD